MSVIPHVGAPVDYAAMLAQFGGNMGTIAPPDLTTAALPGLTAAQAAMPSFAGAQTPGLFDNFFNKTENGITQQGWGGMALGAGSALMNGILGFQQLGVAKDSLAQNKRQFDLNFTSQQKLTNSRLEDRQRARVAANPNAYQSVGDYMAKNGV